jgi:lipid-A-disaccharide synthase
VNTFRAGDGLRVVRESSWKLLAAADAALCKSGTITLEAAVAGCPLIIGYRAGSLDYLIAQQLITIPDIGMVNAVAGRRVVPEFVQDDLDPKKMAPVLAELLDVESPRRRAMLADLSMVRSRLGERGASARAGAIALELANQSAAAQ